MFYLDINLVTIDFFTGKIDTWDRIDKSLIQNTLVTVGKSKTQDQMRMSESDIPKGIAEKREEKAKRKEEEEKVISIIFNFSSLQVTCNL